MKYLLFKFKEIILYGFFGICTTIVNITVYFLCVRILEIYYLIGNIIAWILSVLFAFFTNKKYVFQSEKKTKEDYRNEIFSFFIWRIFSFFIDMVIMFVMVDLLVFPDGIIKILSNIIVILINYFASKCFIFKNKE